MLNALKHAFSMLLECFWTRQGLCPVADSRGEGLVLSRQARKARLVLCTYDRRALRAHIHAYSCTFMQSHSLFGESLKRVAGMHVETAAEV